MVIAIIGSRSFTSWKIFTAKLNAHLPCRPTKVISGGAKGADSLARRWCEDWGIPIQEILPDWSKGRSAGFARNAEIIKEAELVVAFWDGASKGTKNSIEHARRQKKNTLIIYI